MMGEAQVASYAIYAVRVREKQILSLLSFVQSRSPEHGIVYI